MPPLGYTFYCIFRFRFPFRGNLPLNLIVDDSVIGLSLSPSARDCPFWVIAFSRRGNIFRFFFPHNIPNFIGDNRIFPLRFIFRAEIYFPFFFLFARWVWSSISRCFALSSVNLWAYLKHIGTPSLRYCEYCTNWSVWWFTLVAMWEVLETSNHRSLLVIVVMLVAMWEVLNTSYHRSLPLRCAGFEKELIAFSLFCALCLEISFPAWFGRISCQFSLGGL